MMWLPALRCVATRTAQQLTLRRATQTKKAVQCCQVIVRCRHGSAGDRLQHQLWGDEFDPVPPRYAVASFHNNKHCECTKAQQGMAHTFGFGVCSAIVSAETWRIPFQNQRNLGHHCCHHCLCQHRLPSRTLPPGCRLGMAARHSSATSLKSPMPSTSPCTWSGLPVLACQPACKLKAVSVMARKCEQTCHRQRLTH